MATSYTGDKNGFSYIVGVSKPIDVRTVVNSVADLTNGSIQNPYAGLVVNIKGTSDLYVLITGGRGASNINNWKKVSAGDVDLSEYDQETAGLYQAVVVETEDQMQILHTHISSQT